jgi:hypothetical protein
MLIDDFVLVVWSFISVLLVVKNSNHRGRKKEVPHRGHKGELTLNSLLLILHSLITFAQLTQANAATYLGRGNTQSKTEKEAGFL